MQKNRKSGKVDFRRVLAAVLCFAMMVTYMPSTVVAAEIVPGEEIFTEEAADSFDADIYEEPEVTDTYSGVGTEGEEITDDELPSEEVADEGPADDAADGEEIDDAEEPDDGEAPDDAEEMTDGEESDDSEYSEDIEAVEEYDEELLNADPVNESDTEQGEDPKAPALEDAVVFDFDHVQGTIGSYDPFEFEYRLTPVNGLKPYEAEGHYWYHYSGSGDIVLKVDKKEVGDNFVNPTEADLTVLSDGRMTRLAGFFESYDGQHEPPVYFPEYSADGTYITVPAVSDDSEHPSPIRDMMELAVKECEEDDQAMVTLYAYPFFEPVKQVELTGDDSVEYDFSLGEVQYGDRIYPGSNVEKITEQIGDKELTWYAIGDEDRIFFKAAPKGEGVVIGDIIYRVIESRDEFGEIVNVPRSDYPQGKAELVDDEIGIYTISVPRNKDGDWGSVLGLRLEPMTHKETKVTVTFDDEADSRYYYSFDDGEARSFDVTLRVGAQEYGTYFEFDEDSGHTVATGFIPYGEKPYVTIESADGFNTLTEVKLGEQSISPDRNGEYALNTGDKTEVALTVKTAPVTRLCLTVVDEFGDTEELVPEKGTYFLSYVEPFTAALLSGSVIDKEEKAFAPAVCNAVFKLGEDVISEKVGVRFEDNALITDGDSLDAAGSTVSLTATAGDLTQSANITFSVPITGKDMIKVAGARDNMVTGPYAADFNIGISYAKGTDPSEIRIVSAYEKEGQLVLDNKLLIGAYDDEALYVDGSSVLKNYEPGDEALIAFTSIAAPEKVIDTYKVKLTDYIAGKTPTVKANPSIATHTNIGLKLGLPRGVKSSDNLYYKISATAKKVQFDDNDENNNNLSFWDDENKKFVQLYKETIEEYYVPSSETSALIYVMESFPDHEMGWAVDYDVSVTLTYYDQDYSDIEEEPVVYEKGTSNEAACVASTRDLGYETNLKLTKKAPSKVYSGQMSVAVAAVKWSRTTTMKVLERIELIGPYGNVITGWSIWDRWEEDNNNYEIDFDGDIIYIDTVRVDNWWDKEGYHTEKDYLAPGKYTLTARAFAGPGVVSEASVSFQIVNGITDLAVSAPSNVYKAYNKKASFKANVSYYGFMDRVPANRKVTWKILKGARPDGYGDYFIDEFDSDDPLWKALTVKANGTVTLASSYKVRPDAEDNTFVLMATAADYDHNLVSACSEPITITGIAKEPTGIYFRWWNWDENDYNYSNITEEAIKNGEQFFSNNINGASICVLDQFGDEMEAEIKVTGMDLVSNDEGSWIVVKKPGTMTVKATSRDGGKKSKTLRFTIASTDASYKHNVLIQDADRKIINSSNEEDPYDTHVEGKDNAENSYSANMPIYVNVAGVRVGEYRDEDWDGTEELCNLEKPEYGDNALIAHTISVKGGKVAETIYGEFEHYTTYKIIPSARETTITIKDNTSDKREPSRKKGTEYVYKVTNTGISKNTKALSIKGDKKNIYNRLWAPVKLYDGPENVPNRVTYSIKDVPSPSAEGRKLKVRLSMDEPQGDAYAIASFLGIADEEQGFIADGAYKDITVDPSGNGTFDIDFFEKRKEVIGKDDITDENIYRDFYGFWDIAPGTYTFYATVGEVDENDVTTFSPLAGMTRISIKVAAVPKSSGRFNKTKYSLGESGAANLEIATVKNAVGVKRNVFKSGDKIYADAYYTASTNSKGKINRFIDLFYVDNPVDESEEEGEYTLKKELELKANEGFRGEIAVGRDNIARIDSWDDLYLLKNGEYKEYRYDEGGKQLPDRGNLVGTPKEQKDAYKKWTKENLTGFIVYRVVDYSGQEKEQYQKITVNIDKYLEAVHAEAN